MHFRVFFMGVCAARRDQVMEWVEGQEMKLSYCGPPSPIQAYGAQNIGWA